MLFTTYGKQQVVVVGAGDPIVGHQPFIKKVLDRILAMILLMLAAPMLVLIALVIQMESVGPVLFRQPRIGYKGNCSLS